MEDDVREGEVKEGEVKEGEVREGDDRLAAAAPLPDSHDAGEWRAMVCRGEAAAGDSWGRLIAPGDSETLRRDRIGCGALCVREGGGDGGGSCSEKKKS